MTQESCLDCALKSNPCRIPYPVLASQYNKPPRDGRYLSVTRLLGCTRQTWIQQHTPPPVNPAAEYAAWYGTTIHKELEKYKPPGSIAEQRFWANTPYGWLSGSPDLIYPDGELVDFKTTEPEKVPPFNPYRGHTEQLQIYRWLVEHAEGVGSSPEKLQPAPQVEISSLAIIYLTRRDAKKVTVTRSAQVPKANGDGTKSARVPDIWSDDRVQALIAERAEQVTADQMPELPEGWGLARGPLCSYCPASTRATCITAQVG